MSLLGGGTHWKTGDIWRHVQRAAMPLHPAPKQEHEVPTLDGEAQNSKVVASDGGRSGEDTGRCRNTVGTDRPLKCSMSNHSRPGGVGPPNDQTTVRKHTTWPGRVESNGHRIPRGTSHVGVPGNGQGTQGVWTLSAGCEFHDDPCPRVTNSWKYQLGEWTWALGGPRPMVDVRGVK